MKVFITSEAKKQFRRLPKNQQSKIKKKLLLIQNSPLSGKKLTGKLKPYRSLKAWPYRIIYWINSRSKQAWIISILHRQHAYK